MSKPITIHQAAEKAQQLEFINQLIESYPHQIQGSEISVISSLMAKLSGDIAVFLIEVIAGEEAIDNTSNYRDMSTVQGGSHA
ncbi:conserved hypothetical protein [Xenorhabdus bovienii str. Jollieti]|uniref:Uncharacterized protein n=1 Tax=Xenorhabdus bovienii (strain SS-2004) TaxID=406818 RepID=D3UWK8_XENBS|nr:hypothetical protein [Xenorhabdus bovienii]CBJ79843.1 conserved hypothetical protein [Xenorhabdus bovienii SS-2004]CDH29566.1 conserved hypothetical protein [Xenorhabdus bovienii str. Jollieti]